MKQLKRIVLVQFFLHEAVDIEIESSTAFLGPNGSGKSSTLDAIQIAMLGGNQQFARYNTQSVSSKQRRNLAGYCLGLLRSPDKDSGDVIGRARDEARTYIILVFGDGTEQGVISAGLCVEADIDSEQHEIKGLFILPGQNLKAADCVVYDGNDQRPMPFANFREATRIRAKKIGRTVVFTDKSSEYVSELLYALNGERMPDPRRFMSAFVKSMTLKNVDSIDQFVREYVVEPNPVDIAAFRTQVNQFVALRELIRKTKARISRLTDILADYDRAASAECRLFTLDAVKAVFNVDSLSESIDRLADDVELIDDQFKTATSKANEAREKYDAKQQEVTELKVQIESDQTEQLRIRLQEQALSNQRLVEAYQQPGVARANRLINALRDVYDDPEFSQVRQLIASIVDHLSDARSQEDAGAMVARAFQNINSDLDTTRKLSSTQRSDALRRRDMLTEERDMTQRRITAIKRTGRLLNDGATLLLHLLERGGFQAQPVSALARITEPTWAPALEAYLGRDRDALVVLEGNTRDAVRILREARRGGRNIDGAAIVQPNHLRNVDTTPKEAAFAVGMLETESNTVRQFLWQKFGNMRLVDTEADLEAHPRAITRDGMLSQGGLTKSIRVARPGDLRLGITPEDISGFSRNVADLQEELTELNGRLERLDELCSLLSASRADSDDDLAHRVTEALDAKQAAEQKMAALDVSHLQDIRTALDSVEADYKALQQEHIKYERLAAGLEEQLKERRTQKGELESRLPSIVDAEKAARAHDLVDETLLDSLKDEIERAEMSYDSRLAEVERKLDNNRSRLKAAEERASIELTKYVQDERLDVQLAAMSWRERFHWARDEKDKLVSTELQNYETQAEAARQASEETLRSDIAMSLHDRFREMQLERRERNKILESCPAFTGGERYRFIASVVPHYDALVRYINQIAKDDQNMSLFGDDPDEINATLRDLVDAAAESGNASAILDYRQFFTFDLEILVDGKRVDRMSNRQGAGSNGEHIAPMYVAAGAALAKAYRLHNRKGRQHGIGLICLDEAFHGMDTINALATARFLQDIGLQLIMAGPELERTKLAPISQTIYDLDREGLDLLMERTQFKPAANRLMISDMPDGNPQVMQDAYRQLGLDPPSEDASQRRHNAGVSAE
jgi:hypothetical protein